MNLIEVAIEFNSEEYIQSSLWPDRKLRDVKAQAQVLQTVTDYAWSLMRRCNRAPERQFC